MCIILPQKVRSIIAILNQSGYLAHAVGGCVRDLIMGKEPCDWDIATSATPDQVKNMFKKTWDTGLKHGTVTVNYEGQICEITTWRKDIGTIDHRHPEQVEFTNSLFLDLSRRDFTMNALAFHPDEGITDYFHGIEDINGKVIRSVGDPLQRFSEDALRMLRAIRFSAQLDFGIESQTNAAIKAHHADISYISFERIQCEINKILQSTHPELLSLIWETGLASHIFPGIEGKKEILYKMHPYWPSPFESRVALLSLLFFHSCAKSSKETASFLLERLKYDNATIVSVINTLSALTDIQHPTQRNLHKAAHAHGNLAANLAQHILYSGVNDGNDCLISDETTLNLSGNDLLNIGLTQGMELGQILSILCLCIFEKPELNEKETLLLLAKEIYRKIPYIKNKTAGD